MVYSVQVGKMDERPPYVAWERLPVEDREASLAAGRYQAKDVDHAVITPAGSKDRIYREVTSWFDHLHQQVNEGRYNPVWLDAFRKSYEAWKNGEDLPVNGTPIKTWGAISPAQVKTLINADVRTVEDLSQANEQTLVRIGLGARSLKDTAARWLAENGGKQEELVKAQATINDLQERLARMEAMLAGKAESDKAQPVEVAPAPSETAAGGMLLGRPQRIGNKA